MTGGHKNVEFVELFEFLPKSPTIHSELLGFQKPVSGPRYEALKAVYFRIADPPVQNQEDATGVTGGRRCWPPIPGKA